MSEWDLAVVVSFLAVQYSDLDYWKDLLGLDFWKTLHR